MKIVIRAEGGSKIGMGHIMRTLVLAKSLSLNNDVCYLCKDSIDNEYGTLKIKDQGFKVIKFKQDILKVLSHLKPDVLITDSYDVDEKYFEQTKKLAKYTAYIDDINLFDYDVDLIINQNVYAEDFYYPQKYKLLGLKYLMMREEFRSLQEKHINKQVKNIMITMGGSDPVQFTKVLVNWVKNSNFKFHVVIGPSFREKDYFKNLSYNNIKFYFNANMVNVMRECDLAISAAGSGLYELLACGVPTLDIIIADNQVSSCKKLNDMNMVGSLGWYNNLCEDKFSRELVYLCDNYKLRRERSLRGQTIIDGCGHKRVADFINVNFNK